MVTQEEVSKYINTLENAPQVPRNEVVQLVERQFGILKKEAEKFVDYWQTNY